jgi:hypothetical protein
VAANAGEKGGGSAMPLSPRLRGSGGPMAAASPSSSIGAERQAAARTRQQREQRQRQAAAQQQQQRKINGHGIRLDQIGFERLPRFYASPPLPARVFGSVEASRDIQQTHSKLSTANKTALHSIMFLSCTFKTLLS